MDAQTCLNKLRYVGVLSFATVDGEGNPQVRNISAIHQEHCLHCGNCVEHCPVAAVIPREQETVPPET